jgi:polyferredoxin
MQEFLTTTNLLYGGLTLLALIGYFFKKIWIRYLVMVLSVVLFGFLQMGCPSPIGAAQNLLMKNTDMMDNLDQFATILIVLIPVLFIGRIFCAWVCQKGTVQELLFRERNAIKVPVKLDSLLRKLKYIVLVATIILPIAFGLKLFNGNTSPFKVIWNLDGGSFAIYFLFTIVVASIFIYRPFCRYVCPLGAAMATLGYFSTVKFYLVGDCNHCRIGEKRCYIEALKCPPKADPCALQVDKGECIMCGDCRVNCKKSRMLIKLVGFFGIKE